MNPYELYPYQLDAVDRMKNGCILCGGVGSGKSRTALAYYCSCCGANIHERKLKPGSVIPDLYIITTARKRDTLEWDKDMAPFMLTSLDKPLFKHKVIVDSWNNIQKYATVKNAFFILDEQRLVGKGAWVKAFYKIAKNNQWILLSATPGDTWSDYIPVFVANGFFKNATEFNTEHVVFNYFGGYPKIDRYLGTKRLIKLRDSILIDMDFHRNTIQHHEVIPCEFNKNKYLDVTKSRWNPLENKPIENASEYCHILRHVTNMDESRQRAVLELVEKHPKAIIFYNFDYELEILLNLGYLPGTEIAEWNGHKHQPIPDSDKWVYLVQYSAGCEGWNCIQTDTIIFYSQTYSYRVLEQACGRIDRLNTPFIHLYYYHLKSKSSIDVAIGRTLDQKKQFNTRKFATGINFERRKES